MSITKYRFSNVSAQHLISKSETILFAFIVMAFSAFFTLSNLNIVKAQSPSTINFQGKIVNKVDGTNVRAGGPSCVVAGDSNDTCDFRLRIYSLSSGGTLLWEETRSDVEIGNRDGIINFELNSVCNDWVGGCAGSGIVWGDGVEKWLQVEFDSDGNGDFASAETFTRKRLTSVPYAYYADNAGSLNGVTASNFFTQGGNSFGANAVLGTNDGFDQLFETNGLERMRIGTSGQVSIGTSSITSSQLQVQVGTITSGGITMSATSSSTTFTTSAPITLYAGDYIVPSLTSTQSREVTVGGSGTSFTVSPAFTSNVTNRTFTISRKVSVEGPRPILSLRSVLSPYSTQEWQFRVGALATGSSALDIFSQSTSQTAMRIDSDGNVIIGANQNYGGPGNASRLYVYGGANGANVDIMGNGAIYDQATLELQSSDYETTFSSAYFQYYGVNGVGTTMGFANQYLGALIFQNTNTALIGTDDNTPLIFGTNYLERMRLDGSGNLGIGVTTLNAFLDIKAATTASAQVNLTSSSGVDPTTPNSGDLWWNGTNLYFRTTSSTIDLLSGSTGFVQFVPGSVQTTSSTNPLINMETTGNVSSGLFRINENGAGTPNLMELAVGGTNRLVLNNNGQLQLSQTGSTGGLLLGGDVSIYRSGANETTVSGSILPSINDTYTLGSSSLRWSDIYLGGSTIYIGASSSDEGTISYNSTTNVLGINTDNTTNGDVSILTDIIYVDKSAGSVGIGGVTTPSSYLDIVAATTSRGQINLTSSSGVDPTTPGNGDIWWNGTSLNFRTGSSTVDLLSPTISYGIGSSVTSGTTGSVLFVNGSGTLSQNNANFFWDNTNNRLGIGTSTLQQRLTVNGAINIGTTATATAGAIRWTGTDFEGYTGTLWRSFTGVYSGVVNNAALKTTTGAVSASVGTGGSATITMNEYSFFPNARITGGSGNAYYLGFEGGSAFDSVGRFAAREGSNCCSNSFTYWVGWRYVTASRDQEIFAWYDTEKEIIQSVWASEIEDVNSMPIEMTGQSSTWVPIQATIYDGSLTGIGQSPDVESIKKKYKFSEFRKSSDVNLSTDSLTSQKFFERNQCLIDNNNDESKCFKFLEIPEVYYGELVLCDDCEMKHAQIIEQMELQKLQNKDEGADLAEVFTNYSGDPKPGDIVGIDENSGTLVKATEENSLAGIISTSPGMKLRESDEGIDLALAGRVPVKIDSASEIIFPGDFITASSNPGFGKKAIKSGEVVGKALEKWDPANPKDTILVLVGLSYFAPKGEEIAGITWDNVSLESGKKLFTLVDDPLNSMLTIGVDNLIVEGSVSIQGDLTVAGLVSASSVKTDTIEVKEILIDQSEPGAIAGEAILIAGETEIFVPNTKISEKSFISLSSDQLSVYRIKEKLPSEGFTIEIDSAAIYDTKFNYIIFN